MDPGCNGSGPYGHIWRKNGRYRRQDGTLVYRWRCAGCGQNTTGRGRPGRDQPPEARRGPPRGHTVAHPDGWDAFWDALADHAVRVGLHEAVKVAATAVGVDRSTASRWIRRTKLMLGEEAGVEMELLQAALEVNKGRYEVPTATADCVRLWRTIRAWEYLPEFDPDLEPDLSRELRRQTHRLWVLLLRSAAVAAVTVGDPGPLEFRQLSHFTSDGVETLRAGGLLDRPPQRKSFAYWLSFEQRESDSLARVYVCTRTRVVGVATSLFPRMPSLSVRLAPGRATREGSRVLIPVPGAALVHEGARLTFPLELDFADPEAIAAYMGPV